MKRVFELAAIDVDDLIGDFDDLMFFRVEAIGLSVEENSQHVFTN